MIGPPGAEYHSGRRLSGKMLGLVPWLLGMLVSKQLMTGKTNLHRLCLPQTSLSFPDTGALSKNDSQGCHRVARGFIMYHPPQTSANINPQFPSTPTGRDRVKVPLKYPRLGINHTLPTTLSTSNAPKSVDDHKIVRTST
jgi:hypothetical protein